MKKRIAACLVLTALTIGITAGQSTSADPPVSDLKSDEDVLFFPTYAHFDSASDSWRLNIHGKVFEPEQSSMQRAGLIALLRTGSAGMIRDDGELKEDRIRPFLVDNERGKSIAVEIAGQSFVVGPSDSNGHFTASVSITRQPSSPPPLSLQVAELRALIKQSDTRVFRCRVQLIPQVGVSVISDIDDTIKHSQVRNKSELLQNTFVREFQAVEGMATLYTRLSESEVAFHYVSGSPWQLYQPIATFLTANGFPDGSFHLKHFRLKDSSALDLLRSQNDLKTAAITAILQDFPERKFLLFGDSGEQDPEIYGQIARDNPSNIAAIFIRNVSGERPDNDRLKTAFADVPSERWRLFDQVEQIIDQTTESLK